MKKILLGCFALLTLNCFAQEQPAKIVLKKMLDACDALKSAKFILYSTERKENGKLMESNNLIKLQTHPTKIYLYTITPHAGAECLWKQAEMNERVHINPNGFPFFNLKLSPYNSLLRGNSHHLISQIGFDYIAAMTKHFLAQMGNKFYNYFSITDTIQWDNRTCYEVTFDYPPFKYIPYMMQKNETITTIADRNHISDYVILKHNPNLRDYDDVKPGEVIMVPNFYNRKVVFYLDKTNFLPLVQITFDEKGLLEKYELKSFIFNPKFENEEFTAQYKDYGF
jgi:outer membrane lipoprotein-sorting protein